MLVKFLRPFWVLTIISTVGFLFFYIFQVNAEVSERYLIGEYEKKINELSKENKTLQIGSAQIVSLDKMVEQVASLNFEKTDKIHYIRVLETQVVVK